MIPLFSPSFEEAEIRPLNFSPPFPQKSFSGIIVKLIPSTLFF